MTVEKRFFDIDDMSYGCENIVACDNVAESLLSLDE